MADHKTLTEMDLTLHRSWRRAVNRYKAIAAIPLAQRPKHKGSYDYCFRQAQENARFLHQRWKSVRDYRLKCCGKPLKYPKVEDQDER